MDILSNPAVVSMKQKALELLKSGPPGPQSGSGEQPGWRFPQAWQAAWKENQDLQREILATGYVLLPQNDGTLEFTAPSDQDSPWAQNKFNLAAKARSQACSQVVQAIRRDHPALSFEEAWRIAAAENKQLFTPSAVLR
jgi:hypothetical protein